MRKGSFLRSSKVVLCLALATAMLSSFVLPSVAAAGFISSAEKTSDEIAQKEQSLLKMELENKMIQERLEQVGLSSEEALQRINSLTPEARESVVQQLETIQAGGGGSVTVTWVTALLILILVILIA